MSELLGDARTMHQAIKADVFKYGLTLMRGQTLTPDDLFEIAASFGAVLKNRDLTEGRPEILRISNKTDEAGKALGILGERELGWHNDYSHKHMDLHGALLYAVEVDSNTVTSWADMSGVYEALLEVDKQRYESYVGYHAFELLKERYDHEAYRVSAAERRLSIMRGPKRRPLVQTHPISGRKALYLSPTFLSHTEPPMVDGELNTLLGLAELHMYDHVWAKGDLIVYDNLTTMHRRTALDGQRVLWRAQFDYAHGA